MTTPKPIKILIDPGHGGHDPGAVSFGIRESDINLRIASRLWAMLEESGHHVKMTRIGDSFRSLPRRAAMANQENVDLFVSIHANAAENETARGMEVWTSPAKTDADDVASHIWAALKKAFESVTPLRSDFTDGDPDKEARFFVLTATRCPAVLIETGFLTNAEDRRFLLDPENQTDIAAVIAQGIEAWAGGESLKLEVPKVPKVNDAPPAQSETLAHL